MPVVIENVLFIPRRKRPAFGPPPLPPAPPVLVAAAYDDVEWTLTLTFDQAVDVSGMAGSAIVVDDAVTTALRFAATGAVTVLSPAGVRIGLHSVGDSTGSGVTLDASAGNGIVAAAPPDGGAAWAGVTGLALPFP